jgi:hypothetical protein
MPLSRSRLSSRPLDKFATIGHNDTYATPLKEIAEFLHQGRSRIFVGADMTAPAWIGALANWVAFGSLPTLNQSDVDFKAWTR